MLASLDYHKVFVFFISVRQPLVTDFNFRKIKATNFSARPETSQNENGTATSEKGTIYFPSSEAWTHTPYMLQKLLDSEIEVLKLWLTLFKTNTAHGPCAFLTGFFNGIILILMITENKDTIIFIIYLELHK